MNYSQLLSLAKTQFNTNKQEIEGLSLFSVFQKGGSWMENRIKSISSFDTFKQNAKINYTFYGFLKYGICIFIALLSVFFFFKINIFLLPLSVIVFYVVEVHFLFLFPNLIYRVQFPILQSIKQMYRIGLFKSVYIVLRLGIFMLAGLFDVKEPFKNWYIGCLAVVIWYQIENKNRA